MSKKIHETLNLPVQFVRGEVFDEYKRHMDERCSVHEKQIIALETCQKNIDRKITATLVFVIMTLASIITAVGVGYL